MPASPAHPPADLRARLAGVRGLVLDADGVLTLKGGAIAGSPEAIRWLLERTIPFRVVTNFSSLHRDSLAARFAAGGMPIPADRMVTAASAAAAYVRGRHADAFVLATPDAAREFEGVRLLTRDEVDAGASAGAVVVGDGGDDLPFRDLDRAFGLVRRGAELVAMHRNPWWLTPRGETLDSWPASNTRRAGGPSSRGSRLGRSSEWPSTASPPTSAGARVAARSGWSGTTSSRTCERPSGPACSASSC
jgi:hypothetical protein